MRRCLMLLVIVVSACQFGWAQTQPPAGAQFLASDGNLYGINPSSQFFSFSPATGLTNVLLTGVDYLPICLERSDGTFLSTNQDSSGNNQLISLSRTGVITPIVQNPYPAYALFCPALASDGNYYGSAYGGSYGHGFLYQLTAAGKLNVFYNFTGQADGNAPNTYPPVEGSDGNLYFFTDNNLLRYSPTTGLVVFTTDVPMQAATPLEASDGNLYGTAMTPNGPAVVQVQPNGTATSIFYAQSGYSLTFPIAGLYVTGSELAVLTPVPYSNINCGTTGNFFNLTPLTLEGSAGNNYYTIGSPGASSIYTPTLYQGGDGSYFGTVSGEQTVLNNSGVSCNTTAFQNGTDFSAGPVPIQMTLDKGHVLAGGTAELTWQVNNAFSKTMQQCYGFGGLSGKVALSGTATITAPASGSYVTSIVCGGTETGLATLNAGDATLLLSGPTSPIPIGSSGTLTATVTNAGSNQPTGKVEFVYGSQVIASGTLVNNVATVTVSTAGLPAGTYNIYATYPGDADYGPGKSPTIPIQLIAKATSSTALSPLTQSVTVGATAILNATVTGTSRYTAPSGTVAFYYGSTLLGTVALTNINSTTSITTFSHSTAGLPAGNYHITAVYSGDAYNQSSTSPAATVTLVAPVTNVVVSATPNPVPTGSSFSVGATVTGVGTPTGTVTFYAGTQAISSTSLTNGAASVTLPTGTLSAGTYQLTAYYAGDKNNNSATSPAITLTIH